MQKTEKVALVNRIADAAIDAVRLHPKRMSCVMLEYFLVGETIGRMVDGLEKGDLIQSPLYGSLKDLAGDRVKRALIADVINQGKRTVFKRNSGFYPALYLAD
jgi:hypothetical protein